MPEPKNLETFIEKRLQEALKNQKISASPNEKVKEALRLAMMKVGIRAQNIPDIIEFNVLVAHIYQHYHSHTVDEIKLAFDMAMAGQLETENNKGEVITLDANCYESFSCLYFSSIMNAYRKWAAQAFYHIPEKKSPPIMISNTHITTQEEKLADIAEWESKIPKHTVLIPPYLYDYLIEFEKIKPTNKEKWTAMQRAADTRKTILFSESQSGRYDKIKAYKDFMIMYAVDLYTGSEPHQIKTLAKQIIVMDYLNLLHKPKEEVTVMTDIFKDDLPEL